MSEYIDASIIVKWYKKDEAGYEGAKNIKQRIVDFESDFVMSEFGALEVFRALVKNQFPKDTINDAFQSIQDFYDTDALKRVKLEDVIYLAKDLEIDLNLYASDAIHLASAINHKCKIFWTSDHHFSKDKTVDYVKRYDLEIKTI